MLRIFVLVLALVAPTAGAAEPFYPVIPQAVYSSDTVFGPFTPDTGQGYVFFDVDSLTGTSPQWRLCVHAFDATDGETTRLECNPFSTNTGQRIIGLGRVDPEASIINDSSISLAIPLSFYIELDLAGTAPVLTGEAAITFATSGN